MEKVPTKDPGDGAGDCTSSGTSLGRKACFNILVGVVLLVSLIVLPPVILVLSLVYTFRFVVFRTARYLRPDLGKMLSTRSSMFGSDLIYRKPLCSLVGKHIYEGDFDLETIRARIIDNWLEAKDQEGALRNPELKQYVTSWLGFLFWKTDPHFDVKYHVNLLPVVEENEVITEAKLNVIMAAMTMKPFEEEKSPWELFVVPNYVPAEDDQPNNNNNNDEKRVSKYAVLIHWNHAIMDGMSIAKLYLNFSNSAVESFFPKPSRHNKASECSKVLKTMGFIVKAPYESIKAPLESVDVNAWHLQESQLTKKMELCFTPRIPMSSIQEIRNRHGVSCNSVIFALLSGSVRRYMLLSKKDKKIPHSVSCGFPSPYPGHPEKLRNHMTFCSIKLPVGTPSPFERLMKMNRQLQRFKRSTVPVMAFLLMPFVGGLFTWLMRFLVRNRNTTVMFSNMPGPKYQVKDAMGQALQESMFTVGFGPGNLGIAFTGASYNGGIRFCVELDKAMSTSTLSAAHVANFIVEELKLLEACSAQDV